MRDAGRASEADEGPRASFVGAAEDVRRRLEAFAACHQADELIVVSHIYDHRARLRSYELIAGAISRPAAF
jgi:alkanesulfonate monooxygenase SsuD/methylene tetrahydromethanopterin reductase-like flavin-dependent oxidoreductase (luciferase family)